MTRRSVGALLVLLVAATVTLAQQKPGEGPAPVKPAPAVKETVSGKYEGTSKAAGAADTKLALELKEEAGKLSGNLTTPQGTIEISEGTLTDGKLLLKFGAGGNDGALTGQLQDEKLIGEWTSGAQKRSVELKKVGAGGADAALSGDWLGLADVQGGFPFNLTLKVEGEKVTGSSNSQLGDSTVTNGSWKDGRLTFVLESPSGVVGMTATLIDGKLVGEFDFAGQAQGRWLATKKTP